MPVHPNHIKPRFDIYHPFGKPAEVIVVATGVIAGTMRTMGIAVTPEDPAHSLDEDAVRAKLEPMLREWWSDELEKAA